MNRFKERIVIGTGSGIGATTAIRFAQEGARVVLLGRAADRLEKIAADLEGARTVAADVGTEGGPAPTPGPLRR